MLADHLVRTLRLADRECSGPITASGDAAKAVQAGVVEVSAWVTKAAELVPANKYSYRPAPTVRTFGEVIRILGMVPPSS